MYWQPRGGQGGGGAGASGTGSSDISSGGDRLALSWSFASTNMSASNFSSGGASGGNGGPWYYNGAGGAGGGERQDIQATVVMGPIVTPIS